jgi:hypothetical protein
MTMGFLALLLSALFTGAALYVSLVEQPARMGLDDHAAALAEWQPSYRRGAVMQASLAAVAAVVAALAWWQTRDMLFAAGGVLQALPWPWTLVVILPTNKALLAIPPARAGARSQVLMEKWGRLHAVRTVLGCLATAALFWACLTGAGGEA